MDRETMSKRERRTQRGYRGQGQRRPAFALQPGECQELVWGYPRSPAGGFHGGWVTEEIVGPFKGEPGRGGW